MQENLGTFSLILKDQTLVKKYKSHSRKRLSISLVLFTGVKAVNALI